VGNNKSGYQSWHSYTTKLDKGSVNGVTIRPASAKETHATGEKQN
jgi:hypothetical protein